MPVKSAGSPRLTVVSAPSEEPALAGLGASLGADFSVVTDQPSVCDLRIVGPLEIAAHGSRLLRQHRLRAPSIPALVVVTRDAHADLVRDCFREGAADVLHEDELDSSLARIVRRIIERAISDISREDEAARMASELGKRARDLESALEAVKEAYEQTLVALVSALDHRERETACHSQRVALYSTLVGLRLGLGEEQLENLFRGALLHDIGKIGIPDAVLLKPGSFTDEEWEVMRGHTKIGGEILGGIAFLRSASDVPLSHHEAWDGSGYPAGLHGEDIPLHPRIFAVVDSYDAIRSKRPYKESKEHAETVRLLRKASGQRLDPRLVELFLSEPEATWTELAARVGDVLTFDQALRACQAMSDT